MPEFDGVIFLQSVPQLEAGGTTSRIQIAKTGKFVDPRYGKFAITHSDFSTWIRNFRELNISGGREGLPIDVDHSPERRGETRAAGWVKELDTMGADGSTPTPGQLWATVEWNGLGQQLVGDRQYAYLSPSYKMQYEDEAGQKYGTALVGVALTNRPFLTMATVKLSKADLFAADEPEEVELDWSGEVDVALAKLTTKDRQGLDKSDFAIPEKAPGPGSYPIPDEGHARDALARSAGKAEESRVRAAVKRKFPDIDTSTHSEPVSDSQSQMPELTNIAKALQLSEDATEEQVLTALTALAEKVPGEDQVTLSAEDVQKMVTDAQAGTAALSQLTEMKFETAFDKALSEGKTTPAMKDTIKALYSHDEENALKLLTEAPAVVNTAPAGETGSRAPDAAQLAGDPMHPDVAVDEERLELAQKAEQLATAENIDFTVALTRVEAEMGAAA